MDTVRRDFLSELHSSNEDTMIDAVSLGFENKQELIAMSAAEAEDKLSLHSSRHRQWFIHPACAIAGARLHDGLDCSLAPLDEDDNKLQRGTC